MSRMNCVWRKFLLVFFDSILICSRSELCSESELAVILVWEQPDVVVEDFYWKFKYEGIFLSLVGKIVKCNCLVMPDRRYRFEVH